MTLAPKKEYQIFARRYRPQSFQEVVGQEAIVTTLKNAIQNDRLAQAYLFSGPRGTGKTTLARIFAKALNCRNLSKEGEPCGNCSSCKEITSGSSLDVLEIDGASHRGIEDIRQINETVSYVSSSGKYKIYLIDEVHMLTKEAFNALLKTLEEPPPHVKFFFATTEPHKVIPTILSRCQRYNLQRISEEKIAEKLGQICVDVNASITEEALFQIATRADGALRDAESLLDQVLAFHEGPIALSTVCEILGIVPLQEFFALQEAAKKMDWSFPFVFAKKVYREGKDLSYFLECLLTHFRHLLFVKLSNPNDRLEAVPETERNNYIQAAKEYTQEQLLFILDELFTTSSQIHILPTGSLTLELILLRILRSHHRISYDSLISRLTELERGVAKTNSGATPKLNEQYMPKSTAHTIPTAATTVVEESKPDFEIKADIAKTQSFPTFSPPEEGISTKESERKKQVRRDTLFEFASVELGGMLQKKTRRK